MNVTYHDDLIAVIIKMDKDAPSFDAPDNYDKDDLIPVDISVTGCMTRDFAGTLSRVIFRGMAGILSEPATPEYDSGPIELTDEYRDSILAVFRAMGISDPDSALQTINEKNNDPFSHMLAIVDLIRAKAMNGNSQERATITPPP